MDRNSLELASKDFRSILMSFYQLSFTKLRTIMSSMPGKNFASNNCMLMQEKMKETVAIQHCFEVSWPYGRPKISF